MKRHHLLSLSLMLFLTLVSAVAFAAPMSLEGSYRGFNEKNGYIIGKFTMIHTEWNYIDTQVAKDSVNVNSDAACFLTGLIQEQDSGKKYAFDFKPISGSGFGVQYSKRVLERNDKDPYWVLAVPPGTYDLTTVTFRLILNKQGYIRYDQDMARFRSRGICGGTSVSMSAPNRLSTSETTILISKPISFCIR